MSRFLFTVLSLIFCLAIHISAQEASKWRGPNANGNYPDKGLLKQWPENGPEIIWSFDELGLGYTSPVVAQGNIFIPAMISETGYIYKLTPDGKLVWKHPYAEEINNTYPGSRGSVTVAGDLLYILSGLGKLVCMNTSDGKIRWTRDLFRDFDGKNNEWGINETVMVEGDKLYCTPGGRKHNLIALNRKTGDLIWASPGKGELSAYTTPLLIKLSTRTLLVTHTESHIIGIDASDGKFLWSFPHPNTYSIHPNTPIYDNGLLFCFSGYGQGAEMLKLSSDGSEVEMVWSDKTFGSRTGGAVLVDGYLYGSGDNDRSWQCLDWKTGKKMYSSTEITKGTVIYADGLLYCYSERGELAIVKAEPAGFNVVSKTRVDKGSGQHWAHLVINNGVLYVHHGSALIAYKIK